MSGVNPIAIALDGMGGDHAPEMVVRGADLARQRHPQVRFLLFGIEDKLKPLLEHAPALAQVAELRRLGKKVILVSSGAIAEGLQRLGWSRRPHAMHELQAAAAVGQMGLAQCYESCFRAHGVHTAQVLLTHADLADRQRYLNARSTLRTLLEMGVVPVINENDTVVTDEIKLGDNDTLGALVTNLMEEKFF